MEPPAGVFERYFSGRVTRPAFLFCTMFWVGVGFVAMIVAVALAWRYDSVPPDQEVVDLVELFMLRLRTWGGLSLIISVAVAIPCARVAVLRLHDIGVSGWWAVGMFAFLPIELVASIPDFAGPRAAEPGLEIALARSISDSGILQGAWLIGFLFCLFWPPSRGPNRFGPDPRLRGKTSS